MSEWCLSKTPGLHHVLVRPASRGLPAEYHSFIKPSHLREMQNFLEDVMLLAGPSYNGRRGH